MRNKKVLSNTIMQYGFVAARYVFPLLTLPFLARVLGSDTYGVRAYVVSLMLFVQTIADFGFNLAGTKRIVNARGSVEECGRVLTSILLAKLFLLAVISSFIIIFAINAEITVNHLDCVFMGLFGVFWTTLIPDFVFMGFENMGIITVRYVICKTISAFLILMFVRGPEDLLLPFAFDAFSSFVSAALTWNQVLRRIGLRLEPVNRKEVILSYVEGLPFFLSNSSVAALNSSSTLLIGLFLNNATQVAYWSLSVTGINAILSLYNPIANALYPHMIHSRDYKLFRWLFISGTLAALVGSCLFAALSDTAMYILGGSGYVAGSYILRLLSPVLFFAYPALLLGGPFLGAIGSGGELARSSVITAVLYVSSLLVLQLFGVFTIVSVCLCRCGAEAFMLTIRTFYSLKLYRDEASRRILSQH